MKTINAKIALLVLTAAASVLRLPAAVPLSWTVETTRAQPATFEAYQGETLTFEAHLQAHGKPLEAPLNYSFFWQTNGMGSTYWEAPCTPPIRRFDDSHDSTITNVLFATWLPAYDVGAKVYNCFIGSPSNIYHAAFQLRLRPSPGATPNALPLPVPVIDFAKVRVLNPPWSGSARSLPKYLHVLDFDDSYPADAAWYYSQPQDYGFCSSVRDGNTLSRNYDWKFDEAAEFVVRMSAGPSRFASIGVANCGTNLTESIVTSGKPSRYYKCLPGRVVDGINEYGVVCEVNVVDGEPHQCWPTNGTIHCLGAVRWVLDNATNAASAASTLVADAYFPSGWTQNFHWMIADERETWIVENGAASNVIGRAVMTNFRLNPKTYGAGWERYMLLSDTFANITNAWYTRAYSRDTEWTSEFHDITEMEFAKRVWESHAREELRGKGLWQTVHTSIYNISDRVLCIAVQETDDWYTFQVPSAGGLKVETDPTVPAWAKQTNPPPAPVQSVNGKTGEIVLTASDVGAALEEGDVNIDFNAKNIHAYGNVDVSGDVKAGAASLVDTAETAQQASSFSEQALIDAANAQSTADQAASDAASAQSTADSALSAAAEKIDSYDVGYGYSASWGEAYGHRGLIFRDGSYAGSIISPYGIYSIDNYGNWVSLDDAIAEAYGAYSYASDAWSEIYNHAYNYYEDSPGHYYYYTENPHKVTAAQVGAPTVEDMDAQISLAVSSITPKGIGAATSTDIATAISATNDHFKTEVLATGMNLDPTAVAEINRIIARGSFESNCEVVVVRCIGESPVVRRVLIDSGKLYWDPVRQVTWQIDVEDGCFYSHIVSNLPPFGNN